MQPPLTVVVCDAFRTDIYMHSNVVMTHGIVLEIFTLTICEIKRYELGTIEKKAVMCR